MPSAPPAPLAALPAAPARLARRVQDWPTLFYHFIELRRQQPFAWGKQDCCLFACDGILAQTGLDPAAGLFRGQYRGALGAARLVREHGGVEAIAARFCAEHGWPEVPVAFARRGDVVTIGDEAVGPHLRGMEVALGLCVGGQAAFPGPYRLEFHPLKNCLRAWRVL